MVTVTVLVNTQALKSVTITVYTPAEAPVNTGVIPPLLQLYVYAGVPPATVTVPEPLAFPQVAGVNVDVNVNDVGWVTVTLWVIEHPFASVWVTEYVPAAIGWLKIISLKFNFKNFIFYFYWKNLF